MTLRYPFPHSLHPLLQVCCRLVGCAARHSNMPSNVLDLGVTRQPRQNSNGSADTPTCADIDSSGGCGLEGPPTTRDGDAGTLPVPDQGDAGPETLAGDGGGLQVSLSEVRLHAISLAAADNSPNEQAVSPIRKGGRPGVDEDGARRALGTIYLHCTFLVRRQSRVSGAPFYPLRRGSASQ